MIRKLLGLISEVAGTYSSILFLKSPTLGAVICVLTFLNLNIALCGLISLLVALFTCALTKVQKGSLRALVLANSLLVGLFIGYLFILTSTLLLLVVSCSLWVFILTLFLDNAFQIFSLPVLSFPFSITAIFLSLGKDQLTNLIDASYYWVGMDFPMEGWAEVFFRSLASLYCLPDPKFGVLLFGVMIIRSPLVGLFVFSGFCIGYFFEASLSVTSISGHYSHYFNYSLTFLTVASVYLHPSRSSVILAAFATLASGVLTTGFLTIAHNLHTVVAALPFNFLVVCLIQGVKTLRPLLLSHSYAGSPEQTIEQSRFSRIRYRSGEIGVFCPFNGSWLVQQGFDGPWTHRGNWRHAIDFVLQGENGKTFQNRGFELEDYFAYGKPVLSPVDGYVIAVCKDLPDNPIGKVENERSWGNYVILKSHVGYFVALAHFKQNSISASVGDYIPAGKQIGECGNSGYSQEPHIHIQVQWSAVIGAFTFPFHLLNYTNQGELHFSGLPSTGDRIEPIVPNLVLERVLTFRIGDQAVFEQFVGNTSRSEVKLSVGFDEVKGTLYWTDGASRIYFHRIGAQFYFYEFEGGIKTPLADLYRAGPKFPMTYGSKLRFADELPLRFTHGLISRWSTLFLDLFGFSSQSPAATYEVSPDKLEITGKIQQGRTRFSTFLKIDPMIGFQEFRFGNRRYVRVK